MNRLDVGAERPARGPSRRSVAIASTGHHSTDAKFRKIAGRSSSPICCPHRLSTPIDEVVLEAVINGQADMRTTFNGISRQLAIVSIG